MTPRGVRPAPRGRPALGQSDLPVSPGGGSATARSRGEGEGRRQERQLAPVTLRRRGLAVKAWVQGAPPATLAVEECTRFRVVNLKAARALGVRVPKAVLSRADPIID